MTHPSEPKTRKVGGMDEPRGSVKPRNTAKPYDTNSRVIP